MPSPTSTISASDSVTVSPPRLSTHGGRLAVLAGAVTAGGVVLLAVHLTPFDTPQTSTAALFLLATTAATSAVLLAVARRPDAAPGTRWLAAGVAVGGAVQAVASAMATTSRGPLNGNVFALAMAVLVLVALGSLAFDFFGHIKTGRAELLGNVGLVAILAGAVVYLLLHDQPLGTRSAWGLAVPAVIATASVMLVAGSGVLTLSYPTLMHAATFACQALLAGSAIALEYARTLNWPRGTFAGAEMAAALAVFGLAALFVLKPAFDRPGPQSGEGVRWLSPILLTLAFCWMGVFLIEAMVDRHLRLGAAEVVIVGVVVLGAVGARAAMMQLAAITAARKLEGALAERESAIVSLQTAMDVVAESEARLRLLLDSAVDGVVELDETRRIVRANGAFSGMIRQPLSNIIGRKWPEVAADADGGGQSLEELPETGESTLATQTGTIYLEARSSPLQTPPGTLLLIRDVSATKVADQTIRTLFQFLQDRDEDRTRLLKRTNSAIEAERNRIARDLHDGPIQGVSAAALSLEAVRLMLASGEHERAARTLHIICSELSEEAMNLRSIMKDLRPPVLEERGLLPAVRELATRAQRDLGIEVTVSGVPGASVPSDVETLAYRVVQEALTNVAKHASASSVTVLVETGAGHILVEVADDGRGFDPAEAREFLRNGKVGLASMRERAELAGGTLAVRSMPGSGTTVTASLPFEVLSATSVR